MQTKTLNHNYDIKIPKNDAFQIQTSNDFIKLHGIILAIAKRGTGKTTALSNLLRLMKEDNALDRLILVSPTYHNNKHYFKGLPLDEENDVLEPHISVPEQIEAILDQEGADYDEYHEKMKKYKQLMKMLNNQNMPIFDIPPELLLEFDNFEPPTHKYNGKKPTIAIAFDDNQGTDLFKPRSKLSNLAIKHRHLGKLKDGALGCTLMFATQNYSSNSAGINKAIRGNLTHMLVFRNKNLKELEQIADEVSGEINKDLFLQLHHEATKENPHDFLFVDLHKKDKHPSMFRSNFNKFLIPKEKPDEKINILI